MASSSRKVVRARLETLLTAELAGLVDQVVSVKPGVINEIVSLVYIAPGGTERKPISFGLNEGVFYFILQIYVPQSREGSTWTDENAIDRLDDIEASIADVCENSRCDANWGMLIYDGRSAVSEALIEGNKYFLEFIPIQVSLNES